jgi:hypothetical protein
MFNYTLKKSEPVEIMLLEEAVRAESVVKRFRRRLWSELTRRERQLYRVGWVRNRGWDLSVALDVEYGEVRDRAVREFESIDWEARDRRVRERRG